MAQNRTVGGPLDVTNPLENLPTFGAETGVGPIKVPASASRLVEIWASVAIEIAASEEQSYCLRLSGKGMREGDQDFNVGSAAAQSGTAVAGIHKMDAKIFPVQLAVVANESINVAGMIAGTAAAATGNMAVTLVFA